MIKLMHGNCLEEMPKLKAGSIDLILTDPPYGTIKNIGQSTHNWSNVNTSWDVPIDHKPMLENCNRLLRMNGALILFCQDPYTGKLMTETHGNLPFSYRLTWLKDRFANALIAKTAPVKVTEDICVFFKLCKKYDYENTHPLRDYSARILEYCDKTNGEIKSDLGSGRADHFFRYDSTQFGLCTAETYAELTERYNLEQMPGFMPFGELEEINREFKKGMGFDDLYPHTFNLPEGAKHKPNVLRYKKDYMGLHPTQKPIALMEDLVRTYSNEGDTVLDFTMGSGTTGAACKNLSRSFVGIELDREYFETAERRINEQEFIQRRF